MTKKTLPEIAAENSAGGMNNDISGWSRADIERAWFAARRRLCLSQGDSWADL